MVVLLLRPAPSNERFGLGPFFRIEPLGLEYIGAALESRGHRVTVRDLRFSRPIEHLLRTTNPAVVGVACMHALEIDDTLALIRRIRSAAPTAMVVVGGHSAAAFPDPFFTGGATAICLDDGERALPALVDALEQAAPLESVPGWMFPTESGPIRTTDPETEFRLDDVPLPARHLVDGWRHRYACFHHRPAYLIETARGCPFRCNFCSVWQLFGRTFRERSIDSVGRDFAATGPEIFVADDLFWHHASRSLELAGELRRRGIRKNWILVQSRVDLVASHPDLLEAWRPIAHEFDIFFGLEAATDRGLARLVKDTTVNRTAEAVDVARTLGYGVTGNFVIDPDWAESDFEALWGFVRQHGLGRAGYTILTPLPGTAYFEESRQRIRAVEWSQFDMHHLLWEPRLGVDRFFELYCETWQRSVLNLKGEKKWWQWAAHARPRHWLHLAQVLRRTNRMFRPAHYISEHRLGATSGPLPGLPRQSPALSRPIRTSGIRPSTAEAALGRTSAPVPPAG
ncbi:MAG TPA: radical SAM protein [Vicinamibacterales bacterium]|nr:radical SAM protein [Vicinamibacterales bacterium]